MSVFKEKAKDFASAGLNKLPDRANLFLRYMTGIGGRNLDLDDKTVSQIRDSTKESTATGEPGGRFGFEPDESLGGMKPKISFETFKSDILKLLYQSIFLNLINQEVELLILITMLQKIQP